MDEQEQNNDQYFSFLWANKLYTTTSISGFSWVFASTKKSETLFWYILIIAFSFFTVKNVINLTHDFLSGKVNTQVTVETWGDQPDYPGYHPVYRIRIVYWLPFINPDVHGKFLGNPTFNRSDIPNLDDDLQQTILQYGNRSIILETSWNYPFLVSMQRYFMKIRSVELNEQKNTSNQFGNAEGRAALTMYNHSIAMGVTEEELFDKFSEEMLKVLHLKLYDGKPFWVRQKVKRDKRTVSIECHTNDGHELLVWTDRNHSYFSHFTIVRKSTNQREKLMHSSYGVKIGFDSPYFNQYNLKLELVNTESEPQDVQMVYGRRIHYKVKPKVVVKELEDKHGCSYTQLDPDTCQTECRAKVIEELCNCWPLINRYVRPYNQSNVKHKQCSLEQYTKCLNKTSRKEKYDHCKKETDESETKCPKPCGKFLLEMSEVKNEANGPNTEPDSSLLRLQLNPTYEFLVFTEEYATTSESFVGELGGTLDFYLGITLIGIIHVVIYIIKQMVYCCRTDTKVRRGVRDLKKAMDPQNFVVWSKKSPVSLSGNKTSAKKSSAGQVHENEQEMIDRIKNLEEDKEKMEDEIREIRHILLEKNSIETADFVNCIKLN